MCSRRTPERLGPYVFCANSRTYNTMFLVCKHVWRCLADQNTSALVIQPPENVHIPVLLPIYQIVTMFMRVSVSYVCVAWQWIQWLSTVDTALLDLGSTNQISTHPPPLKNGAEGILESGLSVHERVSQCVPTPCEHHIKKQWRKFHLILVTDMFGFIDVLIRFWGQNQRVVRTQEIKGQGHNRRRNNRRRQPVEFHLVWNFGEIRLYTHIPTPVAPTW